MSAGAKVVVVGSLSLDMVFQVPRRPLKGETVKGFSFETFVGGKGNNRAQQLPEPVQPQPWSARSAKTPMESLF
ncbi:MAG: hypothetical protein R3D26_19545 [Cyanobacteriota/Melainabacteria group bacterium]